MTEENGMGFSAPTESTTHSTTRSNRKRKSSSKVSKETEVKTVEEVVEYEAPAPSAPTPSSPVEEPAPVKPWKPLVRPLRKSSGTTEPNRGEMRRTR